MTSLLEEGWEPVTDEGSQGEFTWRVWCDARKPAEAALMGWPDDADFLKTFIEAKDGEGRLFSGGMGGIRADGEELHFCTGRRTGFPMFLTVRVADNRPGFAIETTERRIEIGPAELGESRYGMRFFAMPLNEDERVVTVEAH